MTRFFTAIVVSLLFFGGGLAFPADGSSSAATSDGKNIVKMPCVDEATTKGAGAGLRLCSVVIPEIQRGVEGRVKQQVEGEYQGCELSSSATTICKNGQKGIDLPRPVCNIYPGFFNSTPENDVNHIGESCGEWSAFNTSISGRTCKVAPNHRGLFHRREEGYQRGMSIHALDCHLAQVRNELHNRNLKLTFINDGGSKVEGPCALLAKDFATQSKATGERLQSSLTGQLNVADIDNCTAQGGQSKDELNPDVKERRQSACQLAAARSSLEAVFAHLAACEVFYRAKLSYERFRAITPTQKSIDDQVSAMMNGEKGRKKQCDSSWIQKNRYVPYFMKTLRERADTIWNAEVCR